MDEHENASRVLTVSLIFERKQKRRAGEEARL